MEGLSVGAGVIDGDYRGEIEVVMRNLTSCSKIIEKGQAVAQLIVQPYLYPTLEKIEVMNLFM